MSISTAGSGPDPDLMKQTPPIYGPVTKAMAAKKKKAASSKRKSALAKLRAKKQKKND